MWSGVYFSNNGEHIIVGSHHKAEHNLYIWDKFSTSILKILTGPSELMLHFAVHPFRPIVASISNVGLIYLWTRTPQQNWSAFERSFKELDRNIDYYEPEDEYDLYDESKSNTKQIESKIKLDSESQDDIVDVTTIEPLYGLDNDIGNSPETVFFYPSVYFDEENTD
ncbi:hypothetical protein BB561_000416 [Smittium simulii]|uniref:Uncharacterized protein n=1 Tax=Smittium simulii TaxID=133385 RepID=A0A2T9YZA0_9FUNG|nr:hypothetical protein BB561_000416 [Smittium simulii]